MAEPLSIPIDAETPDCVPETATAGSAGFDLKSNVDLVLEPSARAAVPTGIRVAIPFGYEGQVRPRSGLALRNGISIPNAPGTIDSDFRGEVKVILINLGAEPFRVRRGDRIAQLVVCPVASVEWSLSGDLPETARGEGGFGSTGVASEALR